MLNILSIQMKNPENFFTQEEIFQKLNIQSTKAKRFFENDHIFKRHLLFDKEAPFTEENFTELYAKQLSIAPMMCADTLKSSLKESNLQINDIDFLLIVTSTSFLVPSLSAKVANILSLKNDCQRLDIVGMGCNAGMNAFRVFNDWLTLNPKKIGALICCELGSLMYSIEESDTNHLVNSLFGDAVVAMIASKKKDSAKQKIKVIDFESFLIPNSEKYLRYDWNKDKNKFSFVVEKETPKLLGENFLVPLNNLLKRNKIEKGNISEWLLHSGGDAILTNIQNALSLDKKALQHTRDILKNFGNISSGSFIVSLKYFLDSSRSENHYAILGAMGPGLSIELSLVEVIK